MQLLFRPLAMAAVFAGQQAAAQEVADPTTLESFADPAPQFEPTSPLSYDRTNIKNEGSLTAGVWFSQSEALSLSLGIEQDKLFGTDEQFRLGLEASGYTQNAQITLTDPDFYESAYSRQLAFSIYNVQPNRSQDGDYSFSGARATIGFGRRLNDILSLSFGAGIAQTRIDDDTALPDFISDYVAEEGEKDTSIFAFANLLYDKTDGSMYPRSGYRLGLANELGNVDGTGYFKTELNGSYFAPLTTMTGLRLHGNIALGDTIGSGNYPIYQTYFAGGPGSVRGFAQNTLGPTSAIPDSTDRANTGGQLRVVMGVEVAAQIARRDDLFLLGFYDAGNVFAEAGDFDVDGLRSAVGVGLRWISPIGPVSVYVSEPFNDEAGDDLEQFQFTLGARF